MILALFLACAPLTADECLPTLGDNCSCEPKCMTEKEIKRAQRNGICDLACPTDTAGSWSCAVEEGEWVVVEE